MFSLSAFARSSSSCTFRSMSVHALTSPSSRPLPIVLGCRGGLARAGCFCRRIAHYQNKGETMCVSQACGPDDIPTLACRAPPSWPPLALRLPPVASRCPPAGCFRGPGLAPSRMASLPPHPPGRAPPATRGAAPGRMPQAGPPSLAQWQAGSAKGAAPACG
eukprot:scaffold1219_cov400-Prasinococcus_capsulatus_cf.AAC.8